MHCLFGLTFHKLNSLPTTWIHTIPSTPSTKELHGLIEFNVVQINGLEIESYEEKPIISSFINAGVYALDPDILDFITEPKFRDMPEILNISRDLKKKVIVYPLHESWIDIGRPIDLEIANKNNSREG